MPRIRSLSLLALVAAALIGAPPSARAQGPQKITGVDIQGGIDPPERLQAFVTDIAGVGMNFLPAGAADREGTPISTVGRLRRALDQIGYDAVITAVPDGNDVRLRLQLRAYDRVWGIYVAGNWPLRQDEIIRRISIRAGQALPPEGPERAARLDLERARIEEFLRSQGYLDARVSIVERSYPKPGRPLRVNLQVRIDKGEEYPIGAITVRGNTAMPTQEIVEKLRHRAWKKLWAKMLPYTQSLLREDLATLTQRYRERGYPGARLTYTTSPDRHAHNVRLQIEVNERKHIEVAFEGNHKVSSETLKDKLTIFSRGAYDDYEADASAEAVAQYYRERGHLFVRVSWKRQRLDAQADRLVFTIDEGPSLRVRSVEFVGNRHIDRSVLGDVVNVKVFPLLGAIGLGSGGYSSLRQLSLDVDNLTLHYHNNGFPDAKVRCEIAPVAGAWQPLSSVGAGSVGAWRQADALHVRFLIDEGPEVRLAQINFQSLDGTALPRQDNFLRSLLLSRIGERYRPALIRADADHLRRFFGDQGFPQNSVEASPDRTEAGETITWQVKLGPLVHVGPVFVRGNTLTRESTILEWIPLRPGSVLTTTAAERGQRNLALIQLFNNASPLSFPGEDANDPVVPMVIEVEERHDHLGLVRFGGGLSTDQVQPGTKGLLGLGLGGYGTLGYEHRNLFGLGWTALGLANAGPSLVLINGSLIDPRFLGTLFRVELNAGYRQQATVRLGDIHEFTGSIGLGREMYPGVDAVLRYNLRDTSHTEFLLRSAGPDEEQSTVTIGTFVGSFSLNVDWQRLDNPLVPNRGFKLTGGLEVALPSLSFGIGDDTFVKLVGRSLTVVPILPWLSLRHSVRYDQGLPFGAPVLPKVERFFAGGDTTIRGFELDRARTEVIRSPVSTDVYSVQYRPVGGSLRILQNIDLQFPILRPWYGAVFLDSGVVADSFLGLHPSSFRHGAGFSPLLVKLPIGDISISWAWPLDPQAGDTKIGRLHFNVGLMF